LDRADRAAVRQSGRAGTPFGVNAGVRLVIGAELMAGCAAGDGCLPGVYRRHAGHLSCGPVHTAAVDYFSGSRLVDDSVNQSTTKKK